MLSQTQTSKTVPDQQHKSRLALPCRIGCTGLLDLMLLLLRHCQAAGIMQTHADVIVV